MDWQKKLNALLHDPPHKMWVMFEQMKSHEKVANELFSSLFESPYPFDNEKIKKADQIASAFSRIILAPSLHPDERKQFNERTTVRAGEMHFKDFLDKTEKKVKYIEQSKVENVFNDLRKFASGLESDEEKAKFYYYFLWRFYPTIFEWIETHPADSRAPNHSIYDHLVQTSAVVSALPQPSFLLFGISPVQQFISKARKTQDLWSGSYLLSYLIWQAIQAIIETYGPDSIIIPNLYEQPLMDFYLTNQKFNFNGNKIPLFEKIHREVDESCKLKTSPSDLSIANIPNRFLAIVQYNKEIAQKAEEQIFRTLEELSVFSVSLLKETLENSSSLDYNYIEKQINTHLKNYFRVFWAILPWTSDGISDLDSAIDDYKQIIDDQNDELFNTISAISKNPYYKELNVGLVYPLLLKLAERLYVSRKNVRNFEPLKETGFKCTLCGEYNQLWLADGTADWSRHYRNDKVWEDVEFVRTGERLCGVCLTKRLFPKFIKEKLHLTDKIDFPSTSEIAATPFKLSLPDEKRREFRRIFDDLNQKVHLPESKSVPALKDNVLSRIDGQWLYIENFSPQYFKSEYGVRIDSESLAEIKKFLGKLKVSPSPYYALLKMDGDHMGKWLEGDFNPTVKELLHPKVVSVLENLSPANQDDPFKLILNSKHPNTPSFSQSLSRRISKFALTKTCDIIERKYFGKLVYAGGDDLFAFLPVDTVLDCANELQNSFKETFSSAATMSAGILIAHYKHPLYLAIEEVDNIEKLAKNKYNRNAFCIRFQTRSGGYTQTGGHWELVGFIKKLITKFEIEALPSNLPYEFQRTLRNIIEDECVKVAPNEPLHQIVVNEIKRICKRKDATEVLITELKLEEELSKYEFSYFDFANLFLIAKLISVNKRLKQ